MDGTNNEPQTRLEEPILIKALRADRRRRIGSSLASAASFLACAAAIYVNTCELERPERIVGNLAIGLGALGFYFLSVVLSTGRRPWF